MIDYTLSYSGADSKWHVHVAGKDVFSHADLAEVGFFEARLRLLTLSGRPLDHFWKAKYFEALTELQKANKGLRRLRAGKAALAWRAEVQRDLSGVRARRICEIGVELRDKGETVLGQHLIELSGLCPECEDLECTCPKAVKVALSGASPSSFCGAKVRPSPATDGA